MAVSGTPAAYFTVRNTRSHDLGSATRDATRAVIQVEDAVQDARAALADAVMTLERVTRLVGIEKAARVAIDLQNSAPQRFLSCLS